MEPDNLTENSGTVLTSNDEFADAEEPELNFPELSLTKSASETSIIKKLDKKIDSFKDTVCSFFEKMTLGSKSKTPPEKNVDLVGENVDIARGERGEGQAGW